jgi:hypothetical protein
MQSRKSSFVGSCNARANGILAHMPDYSDVLNINDDQSEVSTPMFPTTI